jgi:hypothetical protein
VKEAVMHTPTNPDPVRRSRRLRSALLTLLALGTLAGSALMVSGPASAAPAPAPAPGECRVIDFRTATVDPLVSPDPSATTHTLTVTGLLPEPANVTLVPLTYIRQPEHWEIEVQACPTAKAAASLPGDPVPPFRLYRATLTFHGTLGSCGIEVVGASMRQKIDLGGPGCAAIGDRA